MRATFQIQSSESWILTLLCSGRTQPTRFSLAWDWHDGPVLGHGHPDGCFISRRAHIATWPTLFTFLSRTILQYHQAARFLLSSVFPNVLALVFLSLVFFTLRFVAHLHSFDTSQEIFITPQTTSFTAVFYQVLPRNLSEFSRRRRGTTTTTSPQFYLSP